MERKNLNKLLYLIGICALILGYVLILGFKDYKQCSGNPLVYGAKKAVNFGFEGIECTCYSTNPKYVPIRFNDEEVKVERSNEDYPNVTTSEVFG